MDIRSWSKFFGGLFIVGSLAVQATDNMTLTSRYLGEGQFDYQLTLHEDPFFIDQTGDLTVPFLNLVFVDRVTPGWQASTDEHSFQLALSSGDPLRPYTYGCVAQSALPAFKKGTVESGEFAIVTGEVVYHEMFADGVNRSAGPISGNVVYYAKINALVPCAEEDADDASGTLSYTVKLIPDVELQDILFTNDTAWGISYHWSSPNTMLVQASDDMQSWTNVAYVLGDSGTNVWYHESPLSDYGSFYRLQLVASRHIDPLPVLNKSVVSSVQASTELLEQKILPEVQIVSAGPEGLTVLAGVDPGKAYRLEVRDTENGATSYQVSFLGRVH